MGDGDTTAASMAEARMLVPEWNIALIAASIAISLLGAFTSTQLMCQAKTSRHFAGVLVWTALGSLTFGFCSIWSLHEVAMLAYGLDLRIGIDVGLTVLSAILAVVFTFIALASDMLWDRYSRGRRQGESRSTRKRKSAQLEHLDGRIAPFAEESAEPLLPPSLSTNSENYSDDPDLERGDPSSSVEPHNRPPLAMLQDSTRTDVLRSQPTDSFQSNRTVSTERPALNAMQHRDSNVSTGSQVTSDGDADAESYEDTATESRSSRRSSSFGASTNSALGLSRIMSVKRFRGSTETSANPFAAIYWTLIAGLNVATIMKGFIWAIAITSMHYVGIRGLEVPEGHVALNAYLVIASFVICWIVCVVGCILILEIETHLGQQLLFSMVATTGVAAMHFTGMRAATFYSYAQPTSDRGYPPGLATGVAAVAIATCLAANLLLAHSATVSRNKLAEIVWTRRKLWMAIAQKETAESAAAARSEFIASASHEIRTPLHHLQGYSDLLSRTELTEEGRLLLYAIQRATKTLSLITNNVLDWSRLEKDGEATCRPVSLDLRTICESIITLLPNQDEDADVEVMVVMSPNVPHSLFIDETYVHRILMNLLSNALKFTSSGYILLSIEMNNDDLVASVTDTGCGIPPTFLPQLFEPFKQAQVRGRARGTGLGLSIIKQLLHKMHGTINVESKFQDEEDVGPTRSGSTFTVTIPVQRPAAPPHQTNGGDPPKIAIFHGGNERTFEGLTAAWENFGYQVVVIDQLLDLLNMDLHYIWVDLPALKQRPHLLELLGKQTRSKVIIPYETQSSLLEVPRLAQAGSHIVPIQQPILWHNIKKKVDAAALQPNKANTRAVRFDPVVTDLEESLQNQDVSLPLPEGLPRQQSFAEDSAVVETIIRPSKSKKGRMVLLVEDNPINCKLGKKMLQSLGYQVMIAEDGVEAIQLITVHDSEIDVILMDQSMPRKDGVTATKEIRDLEKRSVLTRTGRPIIAVSAVVSSEARMMFHAAGATDFLAKPLSLGRLESTLAAHLDTCMDNSS